MIETFTISEKVECQAAGLVYQKNKPTISYVLGTKNGVVKVYPFG